MDELYIDSYRRYKSGTSKFATWLVQAARLCGQRVDFGSSKSNRHLIPLGRFTPLARTVAEATDSQIDGASLLQALAVLREVIGLRRAASSFFRQHSGSNDELDHSNEGHLFVIAILEEVKGILEVLVPVAREESGPVDESAPNPADSAKPDVNIFDVLEVEEIAEPALSKEVALHKNAKTRNAKSKSAKTQIEKFDLGASEKDLYFILFTFFKDLNDIRRVLRETWESYRDGDISLMSASVTTDLALEIVREKERSFLETEVLLSNGEQSTLQVAFTKAQKGKITTGIDLYWRSIDDSLKHSTYTGDLLFDFVSSMRVDSKAMTQEPDQVLARMYDIADFLCVPSHLMLKMLKMQVEGKQTNGMSMCSLTWHEATPAGNTARTQFESDFKLLGSMFVDLLPLNSVDCLPPVTDVWTQGFCELMAVFDADGKPKKTTKKTEGVPTWLAFATTVFLDISHILGASDGRGFQELRETGRLCTQSLKKHFKWSSTMSDPAWTQEHDQILRGVQNTIETHVENDMVAWVAEQMTAESGDECPKINAPHFWFKRHPLMCGILTFHLNLGMWEAGIELTNIWQTFFSSSHMYNMAFQEAKDDSPFEWPDIEDLIALHGEEHLFFGSRPTKATEYANRYSLALGMSVQHLASDSRDKRIKRSGRGMNKGTRLLRPGSMTCYLLQDRYRCVKFTPVSAGAEPTAFQVLLAFVKRYSESGLEKHGHSTTGLVPFLVAARRGIDEETKHLYLDYFSMHLRGWELLKVLQKGLRADLALAEKVSGQSFLSSKQSSLWAIPIYIFQVLESTGKHGARDNPLFRIVSRAVAIIKQFASEQGTLESMKVTERLRGEKPEAVPAFVPGQWSEETAGYTQEDSSSASSDDDPDVDLAMNLGKHAPEQGRLSREQMKVAIHRMKTASRAEMPPGTLALSGYVQSKSTDKTREGFAGGLQNLKDVLSRLPIHAMEEIMSTDDIAKVMDIILNNEPTSPNSGMSEIADSRKRNNKNKNKNRKAKQKAAKEVHIAAGAEAP